MKWEDVVRKLTSRKFWLALIGFITPMMFAMGYGESDVEKACAIVMAGGTLIAYIIGEGLVDASHTPTEDDPDGQIISILHQSELDGTADAEDEE